MLEHWLARLGHRGLFGVGLLYLLEGMGIPLPAEIPLLLSGLFVTSGRFHLLKVALSAYVWSTVGNLIGYAIGYFGGRRLLTRVFRLTPQRMEQLDHWMHKRGMRVLILTRWLNWGFGQSIWTIGLSHLSWRKFLPVVLINNLVWAFVWIVFGATIMENLAFLGAHKGVVAFVILVVGLAIGIHFYQKARLANSEGD